MVLTKGDKVCEVLTEGQVQGKSEIKVISIPLPLPWLISQDMRSLGMTSVNGYGISVILLFHLVYTRMVFLLFTDNVSSEIRAL